MSSVARIQGGLSLHPFFLPLSLQQMQAPGFLTSQSFDLQALHLPQRNVIVNYKLTVRLMKKVTKNPKPQN